MEDERIVELFWARDEAALTHAADKYGRYCFSIANGILRNAEDAQECVNDTYLGAWNAIPPHRPAVLSTFLGKITRHCALKKWSANTAEKRGGTSVEASIDELDELIPDGSYVDERLDKEELTRVLNAFLAELPETDCDIFVRRYWFFDSVQDIARRYGFSDSKVKMKLKRTRDKLRLRLEKEGVWS